jgi:hypothetical protein
MTGRQRSGKRRATSVLITTTTTVMLTTFIILMTSIACNAVVIQHGPQLKALSPSTSGVVFHPASMQFSATGAQANVALAASVNPNYDEQIGMTFTQDFTSLAYNVTAEAQSDSDGYGPAYLLNGLTNLGYWYQVGISWHWPSSNGGYNSGFGFSYQVYGPTGKSVFPTNGGAGLGSFSKAVHSGDSVLLSLTFSGAVVQMLAQDWTTGATAQTSFSSEGANDFVGEASHASNTVGFFTGLMTEWYHGSAYNGNQGKVTYTNRATALSSAWLWLDEFNTASPNTPIFTNETQGPVTFANEEQIYPFSSNGATTYASAHEFITGLLGAASSHITLTSAKSDQASPSFPATYTLAGLRQDAQLGAGNNVVEADPGTSVTISENSTASGGLERWVFRGTGGSPLTLTAGSNATYVYYHIVEETVSFIAGGGNPSSVPLIYQTPPASPSSSAAPVTMEEQLGTTPVTIFALVGSNAMVNGTIPGIAGERWSSGNQSWNVSAPNDIPDPIQLYHQYHVSISYSVLGGGTPPQQPQFASTAMGSPSNVQLSPDSATTGWFDAGSTYSFTSTLDGATSAERWVGPANGSSVVSSPDQALTTAYVHQYYANLGVNDPRGGSVSQGSGWFEAGSTLSASASSTPQWRFEMWNGSGPAAYTGTTQPLDLKVTGPLDEEAVFYVQLTVGADARTNVALSYGSQQGGNVQAGNTGVFYVPPGANVTLNATPSVFIYSFASWQGAGQDNGTKSQLALIVDSPTNISVTGSYNFPVISGAVAIAMVIAAASLLALRGRRKNGKGRGKDGSEPDGVTGGHPETYSYFSASIVLVLVISSIFRISELTSSLSSSIVAASAIATTS